MHAEIAPHELHPEVSTPALDAALRRLTSLLPVDETVLSALRRHVATAKDGSLFLINPRRFAKKRGLPEPATVDAFVAAVRAGLFRFAWTLTCPLCGMFSTLLPRLTEMTPTVYCAVCNVHNPAVLDDMVEVRFRVDPAIRTLRLPPVAPGDVDAARARFGLYQNVDMQTAEGGDAGLSDTLVYAAVIPGGGRADSDTPLPTAGRLVAISHDQGLDLLPPEDKRGAEVRLTAAGLQLTGYTDAPGLHIRSEITEEAVVGLLLACPMPEPSEMSAPTLRFGHALSGKQLLCNQLFRDLFAGETLSTGIALKVENVTLLFTDLKGSTALYDALGDVRAFDLVSEHFKILLRSVRDHGGAVVKTIGDAVMGVFTEPQAALAAALDMTAKLRTFSGSLGVSLGLPLRSDQPPLLLKIGLHCGPCIVVNSNDRLDYFGQTVNLAARVQGLADGGEIVVTEACLCAPGVRALCTDLPRAESLASLKGIGEPVKVLTLTT